MNIGIDARLSGVQHAGIGRYTQNLILNLLLQRGEDTFTLFFFDETQAKSVLGNYYTSPKVVIIYIPIKHYTLYEQLKLPAIFSAQKLDLLHVPHFNIPIFYRGPLVVTIHDLLWHQYQGTQVTTLNPAMYVLKYLFYRVVTYCAVKFAARVITPAQTVAHAITKYYPFAQQKTIVITEGATIGKPQEPPPRRKTKTLLYVGSLYPHKNVILILQALKQVPDYVLLIVGSRSVFQEKIAAYVRKHELTDQVIFLGYLPDAELTQLYQEVTALVQPSFSEGFGLTGVEALALRTPVLASDIPIFREIYQDAVHFFSPYSPSSFLYALHTLETTDLHTMLDKGEALTRRYSWKKMAEKTQALYAEAVKKRR